MIRERALKVLVLISGIIASPAMAESDPVVRGSELNSVLEKFSNERDRRYMEMFKQQTELSNQRFADQAVAVQAAFAAQGKAIDTAFAANERAVTAAFSAIEKGTAAALAAAKEAVAKAEVATEKRFESVNEFREQLKDQQLTFLARNEFLTTNKTISDRLDTVEGTQSKMVGALILLVVVMPIITGIIVFYVTHKAALGTLRDESD